MTIPQTRQRAGGQIATVGGVVQETSSAKDLISADFVVTIYKKKHEVENNRYSTIILLGYIISY